MHRYTLRDAGRVLSLSPAVLRSLIRVSLVRPARGPRGEHRLCFQDLIVLRTARSLLAAQVPRARIRRALASLRRRLPADLPLSGLSIGALGERVVVREGARQWQAESGQYLLSLDVSMENGVLCLLEGGGLRPQPALEEAAQEAAALLAQAAALEAPDPATALATYARAAAAEPGLVPAWVNRGRLLHERGEREEARRVYREGLSHCPRAPLLLFNLGCVLEDLGEMAAALASYQDALAQDPDLADAHYNLARLYESQGSTQHAIRHLASYRRLARRGI
jgi:tetratricopeptide (TPR) repeat protein